MKIIRFVFFYSVLSIFFVPTLHAEDSIINRHITVEREYKPVMQEAQKINAIPEIIMETKMEKFAITYPNFSLPLTIDFAIRPLSVAELEKKQIFNNKNGYVRLGLSNYPNTMASLRYGLIKKNDVQLNMLFEHLGAFGKKVHSTTDGTLLFEKKFETFNFFTGVSLGHTYFNYYGNTYNTSTAIDIDTVVGSYGGTTAYKEVNRKGIDETARNVTLMDLATDSTFNVIWRYNVYAGISSMPFASKLRHNLTIRYNGLSSAYGITEHQLRTTGNINAPIGSIGKAGIEIDLNNMVYNTKKNNTINFWNTYYIFSANPYYTIEQKKFNLKLGVNASFSFINKTVEMYPTPNVIGEWKVIPDGLSIYGGLRGGLKVNTLSEIYAENPYLFPEIRIKDTYMPVNFYMGTSIKPLLNFTLDCYVDYRFMREQYFFVRKEYAMVNPVAISANNVLYTNRFNVLYDDASLTKIGIRANYALPHQASITLKVAYNVWKLNNELYAWNNPTWEFNLYSEVFIKQDINVSANLFFEGEKIAKLGTQAIKMPAKADINFSISYTHSKSLYSFVQLNNALSSLYEAYYGYPVQGTNILLGIVCSF